jgi:hypothetical protein
VAPIFKRLVNDLDAVRRKAESDGNAALKYVVKLLMNNLYGKFGLREDGETNQRLTADQIRKMREKDPDIAIKPYCDDTGEHLEGMYIVVAPIVADYRFPAIGALITAQARLRLLELSNHKGVRIIYCDTDSLHLQPSAEYSRGIPDELVNPGVLGLFKLEEQGVPATYSCRKGYLTPKGLKNKGLPAGSISADVWQAAVESGKTSGGGFIRGQYNAPATFKSAMASGNLTPNKFAPKIRSHISDPSSKAKGLIR